MAQGRKPGLAEQEEVEITMVFSHVFDQGGTDSMPILTQGVMPRCHGMKVL
jgi:hypothetical protein